MTDADKKEIREIIRDEIKNALSMNFAIAAPSDFPFTATPAFAVGNGFPVSVRSARCANCQCACHQTSNVSFATNTFPATSNQKLAPTL
jgi:hypothetical protein